MKSFNKHLPENFTSPTSLPESSEESAGRERFLVIKPIIIFSDRILILRHKHLTNPFLCKTCPPLAGKDCG